MEFANYTLNFGEEKVLLDLFDEVVMPSFFEMKYIRTLKDKGEYFFLDTELVILDSDINEPVIGVTGRIVKNTKLKREQIFRTDGGIIEDRSELETAPSSTFLLILNNHRLILCREVPGAPTLQNFQSTSQFCLKNSHKDYINKIVEENIEEKKEDKDVKRITKKELVIKNPFPLLRVTPLTDKQDLKSFVDRFIHIDKVTIKLLPTNREEIDNDDFWAEFGRRKESINSNSARIEFSNTKEGLDSDEVYNQTNSASNMGNSDIKFKGNDREGDTISGNNDDFSLSVDVPELPKSATMAAGQKYSQFMHLAQVGVISLPQIAQETASKIKSIFNRL